MRRSISVVVVLGLLSSAAIMAVAPSALASIVIGQSIAGVKLGNSEAQVTAVLGPPTSKESAGPAYPGMVQYLLSHQRRSAFQYDQRTGQ
jgi:ABC-type amino acid transport system permease subunit